MTEPGAPDPNPCSSAALPTGLTRGPTVRSMGSRVVVTAVALALFVLAGYVPNPVVDAEVLRHVAGLVRVNPRTFSVVGVGLTPLITSFTLVELACLAWPAWRPLRKDALNGRVRMREVAMRLSILLALIQGLGIGLYLRDLDVLGTPVVPEPGLRSVVVTAFTLTAGTAFCFALTQWVTARGVGHGFSVLLLMEAVLGLLPDARGLYDVMLSVRPPTMVHLLMVVVFMLGLVVLTLLYHRRPAALADLPVRAPAGGFIPAWLLANLISLLIVVGFDPVHRLANALRDTALHWVVLAGISALCSWMFVNPRKLVRAWQQTGLVGEDPNALWARAKRAASNALLMTVAFNVLLVLSRQHLDGVYGNQGLPVRAPDVVLLCVGVAVVLDLVLEWKARQALVDPVVVWPLHDVTMADCVGAVLAAERIPFHLRAIHHRTLLHFFGPYIPIEIMVPATHAEQAHRVIARFTSSLP